MSFRIICITGPRGGSGVEDFLFLLILLILVLTTHDRYGDEVVNSRRLLDEHGRAAAPFSSGPPEESDRWFWNVSAVAAGSSLRGHFSPLQSNRLHYHSSACPSGEHLENICSWEGDERNPDCWHVPQSAAGTAGEPREGVCNHCNTLYIKKYPTQ